MFFMGVNTLFNALMHTPGFAQLDFSQPGRHAWPAAWRCRARSPSAGSSSPAARSRQGWGLTEASPVGCVTSWSGRMPTSTARSVCRCPPPKSRSATTTAASSPIGAVGEICLRGPQVMRGYWQRPDETAKVMLPEGWLRTGDIGRIDERGFVFIEDRKKDMIIVSGFKVYPNEVEDVIARCPGVLEVAAVAQSDEHSGEVVALFVVRKDAALTEQAVKDYAHQYLTAYKRPAAIYFRDAAAQDQCRQDPAARAARRAGQEPSGAHRVRHPQSKFCRAAAAVAAALLSMAACAAFGRVLRVEVSSREEVLGGTAFGSSGTYERITGRVIFALPVANPHNRQIVNLADAVNLKDGAVEFSADVVILRPRDTARGNGTLLLEVPNRGQSVIVRLVDGGDRDVGANAGDGWLLRHGYSFASLGWQWDATGHNPLRLYAPIARDHGRTITGLLRGDVMPSEAMDDIPLGHMITGTIGGTEYPVAAPHDPRNTLTVRASSTAERQLIPRDQWSFAHLINGQLEPSTRHIHLNGGFEAGQIYEYVCAVADPVIAGLGFAAVRDFASYVKHSPGAIVTARRVIGEGISQNGRFLRDMLYQGFNADEQGRIALDGVLAHVAGAGRGSFNVRFAQPSRDAQPTSAISFPTDIFPYTDLPETDPVTRQRDGLLVRAAAQGVVPRIFLSNTSYEYWGRVASLTTTTADGKRDVELSPSVRVYHFTGLQHFSGPWPPARGGGDLLGQQPESPLPVKYFWRAMIANMDAWLRAAALPPASRYPRIDDGTLVPVDRYAFPEIPGAGAAHDPSQAWHLDFGPRWRQGVQDLQPPIVGQAFPVLVPQVEPGRERARWNSSAGVFGAARYLHTVESARSVHRSSGTACGVRGLFPAFCEGRRDADARGRPAALGRRTISRQGRLSGTLHPCPRSTDPGRISATRGP